jgi:hypothetical protein
MLLEGLARDLEKIKATQAYALDMRNSNLVGL